MEKYKQQYHFMGIGLSGVYAYSKSSYSSRDVSTTIPDRRLNCYLGELLEGGVVLDKRTCKEEDIIHYVIAGPVLDCTLPDNHIAFFDGIEEYNDVSMAGSTDSVSQNLYINLWKGLGARVGIRKGNQIHWNNGEVQEIPAVEVRWMQEK